MLSARIDNVHSLIQDIESSKMKDVFTDEEYAYIYSTLEDARELALESE
jgi:hypothetical protein